MNKFIATGNLTKDTEIRMTSQGKKVANNTLAVRRNYRNSQGQYESDFISLTAFEPTSKFMEQYAKKGCTVGIVGNWQTGSYEDSQGQKHYTNICVVESIDLIKQPQQQKQGEHNEYETPTVEPYISEEDLPF